ncbi:MAG: hypothetical protein AAGJ93_17160 [Bacteroidota bacterium]
MEDEIYLFLFQTRGSKIVRQWQSTQQVFTATHNEHFFTAHFTQLEAEDQLSFFLLELDNDTLDQQIVRQLENWVSAENFPATFDQLRADNEIGYDDLLGAQSFLFSNLDQNIPIIFSGIQLFDRYEYELYYQLN